MPVNEELRFFAFDAQDESSSQKRRISTNDNHIVALDAKSGASLYIPPTREKFLIEQAIEKYCKPAALPVGQQKTEIHIRERGRLASNSIGDNAIPTVAKESLHIWIFRISYFLPIAGLLYQHKMYGKFRSYYSCRSMLTYDYMAVTNGDSCV